MKKLLYFSVISALALAGAVEASTIAGAVKEQVKAKVEVAVPAAAVADLDADGTVDAKGVVTGVAGGVTNVAKKADVASEVKVDVAADADVKGADGIEDDAPSGEVAEDAHVIAEVSEGISVSALEIRGWDPAKKAEVLGSALVSAQVQSDADLSNFVATMVINDENIDSVEIEKGEVEVAYNFPAKFLGIFKTNIHANVTVAADAKTADRVKVKFPWLSFLFTMDSTVKTVALTEAIDSQLAGQVRAETATDASVAAEVLEKVGAALRAKHDTVKNSIGNIR